MTSRAKPVPASAKSTKSSKSAHNAKSAHSVAAVEERLGYRFSNPALLVTALTHMSALKPADPRNDSYQRLEFLGDHVLGLVVSDMLFRAFPDANEGELSRRLADLVRKETCMDVAKGLGLAEFVRVGGGVGGAVERLRKTVLGDVCEAVIGAVYLDGGHEAAAELVTRLWTARMHKPARSLRDPKTALQEWAQARGLPTPTYREVARSGPHHNPEFRIMVEIPGLAAAEGDGTSKRSAEKAAALAMLEREGGVGEQGDD